MAVFVPKQKKSLEAIVKEDILQSQINMICLSMKSTASPDLSEEEIVESKFMEVCQFLGKVFAESKEHYGSTWNEPDLILTYCPGCESFHVHSMDKVVLPVQQEEGENGENLPVFN